MTAKPNPPARSKFSHAAEELRAMLPYILLFDGALAAVCAVLCVIFGFDLRLFAGMLAGNAIMAANFLLIGYTAQKISRTRDYRRARFLGNMSYVLRFAGMFVILAALMYFGLISPFTAFIPLFFPKIYYTFIYVRLHGKDE